MGRARVVATHDGSGAAVSSCDKLKSLLSGVGITVFVDHSGMGALSELIEPDKLILADVVVLFASSVTGHACESLLLKSHQMQIPNHEGQEGNGSTMRQQLLFVWTENKSAEERSVVESMLSKHFSILYRPDESVFYCALSVANLLWSAAGRLLSAAEIDEQVARGNPFFDEDLANLARNLNKRLKSNQSELQGYQKSPMRIEDFHIDAAMVTATDNLLFLTFSTDEVTFDFNGRDGLQWYLKTILDSYKQLNRPCSLCNMWIGAAGLEGFDTMDDLGSRERESVTVVLRGNDLGELAKIGTSILPSRMGAYGLKKVESYDEFKVSFATRNVSPMQLAPSGGSLSVQLWWLAYKRSEVVQVASLANLKSAAARFLGCKSEAIQLERYQAGVFSPVHAFETLSSAHEVNQIFVNCSSDGGAALVDYRSTLSFSCGIAVHPLTLLGRLGVSVDSVRFGPRGGQQNEGTSLGVHGSEHALARTRAYLDSLPALASQNDGSIITKQYSLANLQAARSSKGAAVDQVVTKDRSENPPALARLLGLDAAAELESAKSSKSKSHLREDGKQRSTCGYCGESGHYQSTCAAKKQQRRILETQQSVLDQLHELAEMKAQAAQRASGSAAVAPLPEEGDVEEDDGAKRKDARRCKICNKPGHYQSTCPVRKKEEALHNRLAQLRTIRETTPAPGASAIMESYLEPPVKKKRKQTERKGGAWKDKAPRACGLCGKFGHYKATCSKQNEEIDWNQENEQTASSSTSAKRVPKRIRAYMHDRLLIDASLTWSVIYKEMAAYDTMKADLEATPITKMRNLWQNLKQGRYKSVLPPRKPVDSVASPLPPMAPVVHEQSGHQAAL